MAAKTAQRYEKFAREWVIDHNGTRAAIAAGYSEKGAHVRGTELLKNRKVQRLIDALNTKRYSKLEVTAEKITEELARLGFSNMLDYVDGSGHLDLSTLTRDQAAAIQEIREDTTGGSGDGERKLVLRTTFKLSDKLKALQLLGQTRGMFQEKVEHTADDALLMALAAGRRRLSDLP
jgi:phage terminase small subunit